MTFSSANLGYALVTFNFTPDLVAFVLAALGVALIGVTNLAVSFSLALYVAMKSRGVRFGRSRELLSLLAARFRSSPREFLLPPRARSRAGTTRSCRGASTARRRDSGSTLPPP